jgi:hypothetical protein
MSEKTMSYIKIKIYLKNNIIANLHNIFTLKEKTQDFHQYQNYLELKYYLFSPLSLTRET